jgi:phosphoribosylformylglycinamidine synthase
MLALSMSVKVMQLTFKIESHNHPSFVEPYQGAATGVGGIVRDILDDGCSPNCSDGSTSIWTCRCCRYSSAFYRELIAGVGGYGNCLGLPNIGGEVVFDETYIRKPIS